MLDHEIRRGGISGSEIAAVVGIDRNKSPIDVYVSKVEGRHESEENSNILRGKHLGPALVDWYSEKTGKTVTNCGSHEKTLVSVRYPLVRATPDGLIHSAGRMSTVTDVLEVKSPSHHCAQYWGEPGTDQIPEYYIPQGIWEMESAGVQRAQFAALINDDLAIYQLDFDDELFHVLHDEASRFWHDHVLRKIPPPPDGSTSHDEYLKKRFPINKGFIAKADENVASLMQEYKLAEERADAAEIERKKLKQAIESAIGDFDGFEADGIGKITWRTCKGRETVDWKGLSESLGASEEQIKSFTKRGDSYRRFLANFKVKGV